MSERALDPRVIDLRVIDTLRQLNQPGEPDVVSEVLTLFLSDAPVRLAAIRTAIEAQDPTALQRAAHTLKGAAGTIGATALQQCCKDLEGAGKSGVIPEAATALVTLEREYTRLHAEITQLL